MDDKTFEKIISEIRDFNKKFKLPVVKDPWKQPPKPHKSKLKKMPRTISG